MPTEREDKLIAKIESCYRLAQADHARRLERFEVYYRRFRGLREGEPYGEEAATMFYVPAIKWVTYAIWSRMYNMLVGPTAKIKVIPRGPSDVKLVRKVETYMRWRVFEYMRAHQPLSTVIFQTVLYGRSHAYLPWSTKKRRTSGGEEIVYNGPELIPLWPDEIILPSGDYSSLQEAPWVMRRYLITPQELIDGEREGRYQNVRKNWDLILGQSTQVPFRDEAPILSAKDEAESVYFSGSATAEERPIEAWEWYGRYRESESYDESEIMVRYLPQLRLIVGVYDLDRLFPGMSNRRPFVSFSMAGDGSYWPPGVGELCLELNDELAASDRMISRALEFTGGPVLFFRPTGGFDPESFRYRPGMAYPVDDPSAVREISFRADIENAIIRQQMLVTYLERVTGISDQTLGRSIERPNAPRTLGGQQILLQQGNLRSMIDIMHLREGMKQFLRHVWELDSQFADSSVFFRVTEEEAGGLFDVKGGFAEMTPDERGGFYDFEFELADEPSEKDLKKAEALQLYQIDLGNPLIAQNPRALWTITNRLHEAFGDTNFKEIVPEPPDPGLPKQPRDEWISALQGEPIQVHPMDNDEMHLAAHYADLEMERQSRQPDEPAMRAMARHIAEHQSQLAQKRMMVGMAKELARSIEQSTQSPEMGGIVARPPVPVHLQGLMAAIQDLAGQAMPATGGQNAVERK